MMKSLKLPVALAALVLTQVAVGNPLYSWKTKDGTPTYSPDPPPEGVSYEIVGADLKPLQGEAVTPPVAAPQANAPAANQAAKQTTAANTGNVAIAPTPAGAAKPIAAPATPQSPWKPVVYANDPNPSKSVSQPAIAAAAPSLPAGAADNWSPACTNIRQELLLLESQFANAFSAKQMDDAIVRMHSFRKENTGACGL